MNPHIGTHSWGVTSTGRIGVVNMGLEWGGTFEPRKLPWAVMNDRGAIVMRDDGTRARFATHAEAIAYAHREATKAIAAKNQLPLREETPC